MPGTVKLGWVENDAARRTRFRKRRVTLLKKVEELSVLTESQACCIVFNSNVASPKHWPSEADAHQVIGRILNMPDEEQQRNGMNVESHLGSQMDKIAGQLEDMKMERKEREINQLIRKISFGDKRLNDLKYEDASNVLAYMEKKRESCEKRIDQLRVPS